MPVSMLNAERMEAGVDGLDRQGNRMGMGA
jgi:hypothetical protein